MAIKKTGTVTVTEHNLLVQDFTFYDVVDMTDAAIEACTWAVQVLNSRIAWLEDRRTAAASTTVVH